MELKKFYLFEDKPPIYYRPGTSDEAIIDSVLIKKQEYLFPAFSPRLIFDIGGNFGALAVLMANIYPDAKIYSFEPVKENYEILIKNADPYYPNIIVMDYGLGDANRTELCYPSEDPNNLGGFSNYIESSGKPFQIEIRDVEEVCKRYGNPDLVKIDCEGAECEILTSLPLSDIKWITGELHSQADYELLAYLNKKFDLQFQKAFGEKVWHFHAKNKTWDWGQLGRGDLVCEAPKSFY